MTDIPTLEFIPMKSKSKKERKNVKKTRAHLCFR